MIYAYLIYICISYLFPNIEQDLLFIVIINKLIQDCSILN